MRVTNWLTAVQRAPTSIANAEGRSRGILSAGGC